MKILLESHSMNETVRLGRKIGKNLKAGDLVALTGELGAGKTTLVKGIVEGLGVPKRQGVVSPTFILIHEYQGREKVFHMDWYRLKTVRGADELLAEECFSSGAVNLVEWAEKGGEILPKERIHITLRHKSALKRKIEISATGKKYKAFYERMK